MFSSIFSVADPKAPNFHPVSSKFGPSELCGELEPKDTEWLCAGGFATETQIFYILAEDGTSFMCQVIHSAVGLWYPQIQFTCKIFNEQKNVCIWKSVNVSNFVTPPPGLDKRSSKADEFSVTYKAKPGTDHPESYIITANLGNDLQLAYEVQRPASVPGFKLGKGSKGGYSYFGQDTEKAEGYVIHRFWPRLIASGHIILNGQATAIDGPGMFVHAIQGMRPNLVAQSWNFAHFQSNDYGGVSAIQMEFKTTPSFGRTGSGSGGVMVNVGCLVIGGKLATVTAETIWPNETPADDLPLVSRAVHLHPLKDSDTGYRKPSELLFRWAGPSLISGINDTIKGDLEVNVGDVEHPKGLIEKVDVLAEIPYVVKMAVNYVAGTKPYIYQWLNRVKLTVQGPESLLPGLSKGLEVEGLFYNEATFISSHT